MEEGGCEPKPIPIPVLLKYFYRNSVVEYVCPIKKSCVARGGGVPV